jgi:hypothetical protein
MIRQSLVVSPALAAKVATPADSVSLAAAKAVELPLADTKAFAKDEAKIAADDKRILEEAKLSGDKAAVAKAGDLVERDRKLLSLAGKLGPDPDVRKQIAAALKTDKAIQTPLLAEDRKIELKRDDADLETDAYDVAILPDLGPVLALPTEIEDTGFWKSAAEAGAPVVFYDENGADFKVAPETVLKLDDLISQGVDRPEDKPDAILAAAFAEGKPLYEKFGEAGLLADLLAIQPFDKSAAFKSDVRALDTLIVDLADRKPIGPPIGPGDGGVGGVPEPATWSLMLVGVGGLGAMLRRRRARRLATA